MRLTRLRLRNYRNYANLDYSPGPALNILLGRNGQGKTNLLESISLLALSSSPRARRDAELVGPLAPEARVEGELEPLTDERRAAREITIGVPGPEMRTRRRIEVDGVPRRAVDLPGILRAVLFWPEDLSLVKSGPEHRRRLLNQMLVQVQPGYAATLARYARVVEQRNALLKQVASGLQPHSALDVWDEELARHGSPLAAWRAEAVAHLEPLARAWHARVGAGEVLDIAYQGPPAKLAEAVHNSRTEDVRRGVTTSGPHRDDILIRLGAQDARGFASQGQQRTVVVALKLAEAELIELRSGQPPMLLLDDVLSELDGGRRRALLETVGERGQVVITSVETAAFPASMLGGAEVRCIEAGQLVACG